MPKKINMLLALIVLLSMLMTGCGSSTSAPNASSGQNKGNEKLDVAFVIPGSISDGSFGTISYKGVQDVKGADFIGKADYIEGINAATDASKAIRDYVAAGYDVVWAQSGAYGAAVMELAPEFPDNVL